MLSRCTISLLTAALLATLSGSSLADEPRRGLFAKLFAPSEPVAEEAIPPPEQSSQPSSSPVSEAEAEEPARPQGKGLFGALFGSKSVKESSTAEPIFTRESVEAVHYNTPISPSYYHWNRLARTDPWNTRLVVDVGDQKAYLMVDDLVAVEVPVSTGRTGKYTPRGDFRITERVRTGKISTIYHVAMPYWQRLDHTLIGVHAGHLPGYPASAGCIRLPKDAARVLYDNMQAGTLVSVRSNWTPPHSLAPDSTLASR